jgi:hypothetical protein
MCATVIQYFRRCLKYKGKPIKNRGFLAVLYGRETAYLSLKAKGVHEFGA